jgi:hypothetical protein
MLSLQLIKCMTMKNICQIRIWSQLFDNGLILRRSNILLVVSSKVTHLLQVDCNLLFIPRAVFMFYLFSRTYDLTTLGISNGEKYALSKQIIQSQRLHALVNHKKYCDETGFQCLGKSKLYGIIDRYQAKTAKISS